MARTLELDPPRLTGDPTVIAEGIGIASPNGYADFSVSGNGTLFYGRGSVVQRARCAWRDRSGKVLETIGPAMDGLLAFSLSPDNGRVAYVPAGGQSDVWVLDLARATNTRVSFTNGQGPEWSPDGRQVFYANPSGIHRKAADGSGEEELVVKGRPNDRVNDVSPDGSLLLFGFDDIFSMPLKGEPKPQPWVQSKFQETSAAFSPDGRWVAYRSSESGRPEIYIQGFPDHRGKWLISSAGGVLPQWRADGKELFWRGLDDTLMAASIDLQQAGVRAGQPQPLFRLPPSSFSPARDGKRFLVPEPEGGQQPDRPMVVQLNWAAARLGK
jgi:Tol biopolymer transport system component